MIFIVEKIFTYVANFPTPSIAFVLYQIDEIDSCQRYALGLFMYALLWYSSRTTPNCSTISRLNSHSNSDGLVQRDESMILVNYILSGSVMVIFVVGFAEARTGDWS
jgi:hypothetical protein